MSNLKNLNNSPIESIDEFIKETLKKKKKLEENKSEIEKEIKPQTIAILDIIMQIDRLDFDIRKATRIVEIKKDKEKSRIERENMKPKELTQDQLEEILGYKIAIKLK